MDLGSPAALATALVTMLTVLLFIYLTMQTGRLRGKHKIAAPAMTGHPEFERAVRVHMNTIEGAIAFLPALWVAEVWLPGWIAPILGFVWVLGRVIYSVGYMAAAEKRETGFLIQAVALIALIVVAFWGIVRAWLMV